MQDHGLSKRLPNKTAGREDKTFGYIVDYKDLFKQVQGAMAVYHQKLGSQRRRSKSRYPLAGSPQEGSRAARRSPRVALVTVRAVQPPKAELGHIHYSAGNIEIPEDLQNAEPQRVALYKSTAGLFVRTPNIADDLAGAGYTDAEIGGIKKDVERYLKLREIIRQASGETIDLQIVRGGHAPPDRYFTYEPTHPKPF